MNLKEINTGTGIMDIRHKLKEHGLEMYAKPSRKGSTGRMSPGQRRVYEVWSNSTTRRKREGGLIVVCRGRKQFVFRFIED